ncbi:MAG: hypothetical protein ACR2PS_18500 [Pseudomonadales bacterium]
MTIGPGTLVVCLKDFNFPYGPSPKASQIYTVREVIVGHCSGHGFLLEEVLNKKFNADCRDCGVSLGHSEPAWSTADFRPVNDDSIAIFRKLAEDLPVDA